MFFILHRSVNETIPAAIQIVKDLGYVYKAPEMSQEHETTYDAAKHYVDVVSPHVKGTPGSEPLPLPANMANINGAAEGLRKSLASEVSHAQFETREGLEMNALPELVLRPGGMELPAAADIRAENAHPILAKHAAVQSMLAELNRKVIKAKAATAIDPGNVAAKNLHRRLLDLRQKIDASPYGKSGAALARLSDSAIGKTSAFKTSKALFLAATKSQNFLYENRRIAFPVFAASIALKLAIAYLVINSIAKGSHDGKSAHAKRKGAADGASQPTGGGAANAGLASPTAVPASVALVQPAATTAYYAPQAYAPAAYAQNAYAQPVYAPAYAAYYGG